MKLLMKSRLALSCLGENVSKRIMNTTLTTTHVTEFHRSFDTSIWIPIQSTLGLFCIFFIAAATTVLVHQLKNEPLAKTLTKQHKCLSLCVLLSFLFAIIFDNLYVLFVKYPSATDVNPIALNFWTLCTSKIEKRASLSDGRRISPFDSGLVSRSSPREHSRDALNLGMLSFRSPRYGALGIWLFLYLFIVLEANGNVLQGLYV